MFDMRRVAVGLGALLVAIGCSNGGSGTADGAAGGTGGRPAGFGGAPSQATDTNPANPHVTMMPPASPNGPQITIPPGGPGAGGSTGTAGATGSGGDNGGAAGTTGAGAVTGSAGATGAATGARRRDRHRRRCRRDRIGGHDGQRGRHRRRGHHHRRDGMAGATGSAGVTGTGGGTVTPRDWPTVDCVGGPCAAPNVCVNLDFLFVACVPCGGNDQVCCPPFAASDPFAGTCDPGLVCAANPNFQSTPPTDLVQDVCQVPGCRPPPAGSTTNARSCSRSVAARFTGSPERRTAPTMSAR